MKLLNHVKFFKRASGSLSEKLLKIEVLHQCFGLLCILPPVLMEGVTGENSFINTEVFIQAWSPKDLSKGSAPILVVEYLAESWKTPDVIPISPTNQTGQSSGVPLLKQKLPSMKKKTSGLGRTNICSKNVRRRWPQVSEENQKNAIFCSLISWEIIGDVEQQIATSATNGRPQKNI